jgi:3-hydroxybutyryl-CoA dehydrogenase
MRLGIIANKEQKLEWLALCNQKEQQESLEKSVSTIHNDTVELHWLTSPEKIEGVSIYLDFLFESATIEKKPQVETMAHLDITAHLEKWKAIDAELIVVSAMCNSLASLPNNFIRINGWPGFLGRPLVEASTQNEQKKKVAEEVFKLFGRKTEWVKDQAGFITARVVASIINEAYYSLGEDVSDKENINLAMKLGTNYPHGPFEWASLIGLKNVYSLLKELSKENERYLPAALLEEDATKTSR